MAFFTPVLETVTRIMITRMMILEWCSEDSRIPRRYLGTCYELSNWSPGLSSPSINHSIDIFFLFPLPGLLFLQAFAWPVPAHYSGFGRPSLD